MQRLRTDQATIELTCNWLRYNENDEMLSDVFESLISNGVDDHLLNWSLEWFKSSPRAASDCLPLLIKHTNPDKRQDLFDWAEQFIMNCESDDYAYLASWLITDYNQKQLIPWSERWLNKYHDWCVSATLILSLLSAQPDASHIGRATEWLEKNRADWYSNVILSKLLEVCPTSDLIDETLRRLESEIHPEFSLVVGPLVRTGRKANDTLAGWIQHNVENPLAVDILYECLEANADYFTDTALLWLSEQKVLSDKRIVGASRAWIKLNDLDPRAKKLSTELQCLGR